MQPQLQPVNDRYAAPAGMDLALERNRVLRNTYMLLALSLVPSVVGAYVGVNTDFAFLMQYPIAGPLVMLALMIGLLFGVTALRNSAWGIALLFGFTFIAGWWLGPMLQHALALRNGAQIVGLAAGGTAVVFFVMAGIATVSKRDFSALSKFLFVGLIMLVLASIANLFFHIPALALTISVIGVFVFSLLILVDVNRVVTGGETNYIMATMAIYLDLYNLFVSLLNILMALMGQRD
jgi:modulator of FtsH protease